MDLYKTENNHKKTKENERRKQLDKISTPKIRPCKKQLNKQQIKNLQK